MSGAVPEWIMYLWCAIEEIAAGDGAISTIVSVQNSLICGITLAYGSEQQNKPICQNLPLANG